MQNLSSKLSIVQNFICTSDGRRDMIIENLPKMAQVFEGIDIYVSYNAEQNFEALRDAYAKYLPWAEFKRTTGSDWGLDTLKLLEKVKTPHVMYICEDFDYLAGRTVWESTLQETIVDADVDFMMLAKIAKYNQPRWHKHYHTESEHAYFYHSKKSPSYVLSVDAIYRKDFFVERLNEYTDLYSHHLPNNYETYYKHDNSLKRFDIQCCIPKNLIVEERHPDNYVEAKRTDLSPNKPLGDKSGS